jgi:hypothetical protein
LFDPSKGTPVLVVTFIAMLELAKETLIEITQAEAFAPIYVRLAYTPLKAPPLPTATQGASPESFDVADCGQRPGGPERRAAPGAHAPRGGHHQARPAGRLQRLGAGRHCRRAGRGRQLCRPHGRHPGGRCRACATWPPALCGGERTPAIAWLRSLGVPFSLEDGEPAPHPRRRPQRTAHRARDRRHRRGRAKNADRRAAQHPTSPCSSTTPWWT